jgi:hypothetical protein
VAVAGEITDSPSALASVIIALTQSFSMNTLGSAVMWLNLIAAGVDDLAVSKHSDHVSALHLFPSSSSLSLYAPHSALIYLYPTNMLPLCIAGEGAC